ncbi:hypothetical protein IV102_33795 [bacterium]|nr:hypothetical protein [bacterium]
MKVVVIYGCTDDPTAKNYNQPSASEFIVGQTTHPGVFQRSGLRNATRFKCHRFKALEFHDLHFVARGTATYPVEGSLVVDDVYHPDIHEAFKAALDNSKLGSCLSALDAARRKQQAQSANEQ